MPLSLAPLAGALTPVLRPVIQPLTASHQPAPASVVAPVAPVVDAALPLAPVAEALVILAPALADLGLPGEEAPPVEEEPVTELPVAGNPDRAPTTSDPAAPGGVTPSPATPPAFSAPRSKASAAEQAPGLVDRLSDAARRDTLLAGLLRAERQLADAVAYAAPPEPVKLTAAEIGARAMAGLVAEAKAEGAAELALID